MPTPSSVSPRTSSESGTETSVSHAEKGEELKKVPTDMKRVHSISSEMYRRASAVQASFKRPRTWVLAFGWSLAFCAGIVNVVAFRSWHTYVSHMTGDTTAIGMRIEGVHQRGMEFFELNEALLILVSFLFGAFLCGILIDKNQVHFGGKSFYGLALVGNSILLIIATFQSNFLLASCFAAIACGLQNAMCTSHFGAVVRTTHVTGTVTDIGSTLGRITMIYLRHGCRSSNLNIVDQAEVGVDARKLLVLLPMLISYLFGTTAGAYFHTLAGVYALLIPATLTGVVGTFYTMFRQQLKGYLKNIEAERLNKDFLKIRGTLERTQMYLHEFKATHPQASNIDRSRAPDEEGGQVVIELEEGFEDMLERLHDIEEEIETFCHSPRGRVLLLVPMIANACPWFVVSAHHRLPTDTK